MIRRGFWLVAGATAGIMGYRRVASLGRTLSGTELSPGGTDFLHGGLQPPGPRTPRGVPDGKAKISGTRNPAGRKRAAGRGLARQTIRLTRDVRRFNRDVREGMDLYLVRHPARQSPTLGAVSTRGDGPPARGAPASRTSRTGGSRPPDFPHGGLPPPIPPGPPAPRPPEPP